MKYSLKDLFWSTTLASAGAATGGILIRMNLQPSNSNSLLTLFVEIMLLLVTGILFGAAAGHILGAPKEDP